MKNNTQKSDPFLDSRITEFPQYFNFLFSFYLGILSKYLKIRPRNDQGFTYLKRDLNPCIYRLAYTTHRITSMEMHHLYASLKTINFLEDCKENTKKLNTRISKIIGIFSDKSRVKKKKNTCY